MYATFFKRGIDALSSFLLIVLLAPILFVISMAILLTSRGPVLLSQNRIGLSGKPFACLKFRTMYTHSHSDEKGYRPEDRPDSGFLFKIDSDPRVTPVGKFLRRYSLDELPQLFNVLLGTMSLVGPRPLIPFMVVPYPAENALRAKVRPGITGLWQIRARAESNSVLQMIAHDAEYIETLSTLRDVRIMLRTIPAVLSGRGAK